MQDCSMIGIASEDYSSLPGPLLIAVSAMSDIVRNQSHDILFLNKRQGGLPQTVKLFAIILSFLYYSSKKLFQWAPSIYPLPAEFVNDFITQSAHCM